MPTIMLRDDQGEVLPVLRPKVTGGSHKITTSGSSARNSTPFDSSTRVIGLYATATCRVRLGGASIEATANDHIVPAGIYLTARLGDGLTHIAAIQDSAAGVLNVSEFE